jgi:hypothetical protein
MRTLGGLSTVFVAATLLWGGAAAGQAQQQPSGTDKARPAKVVGQVVKLDPGQGKVIIRASDGTIHEFQASPETIQDLKVGDRIEASLRSPR